MIIGKVKGYCPGQKKARLRKARPLLIVPFKTKILIAQFYNPFY